MATAVAAVALISAIGGQVMGMESRRKQASMQEDASRAQEKQQLQLTQFELARHAEESKAYSAKQKAAFAASGISLDPDQTPFTVMSETQRRFAAERQRIASGGAAAAGARRTEAGMFSARQRNIRAGSALGSLGTLAGGIGQFYTPSSSISTGSSVHTLPSSGSSGSFSLGSTSGAGGEFLL